MEKPLTNRCRLRYYLFTNLNRKEQQMPTATAADPLDQCRCKNPPKDDGETTCWVHHDCSDGSCTHQE